MEKDIDISIDDLYVHLYETSGNKVTNEFNISVEKKKFVGHFIATCLIEMHI